MDTQGHVEPVVVYEGGGWWVRYESEAGNQQFRCATEGQARRFADTLSRQPLRTPVRSVRVAKRPSELPAVQVLKKPHRG
jgi:hypothetical protein